MRNHIVQAYDRIDPEIVWQVVQEELPPLVAALQRMSGTDSGYEELGAEKHMGQRKLHPVSCRRAIARSAST
jgi:hypothetical protein